MIWDINTNIKNNEKLLENTFLTRNDSSRCTNNTLGLNLTISTNGKTFVQQYLRENKNSCVCFF